MLKKLNVTVLSITLMLYAFGVPLASTTEVFPVNDFWSPQPPLPTHSGDKSLSGSQKSHANRTAPVNVPLVKPAVEPWAFKPSSGQSGAAKRVDKRVCQGKSAKDTRRVTVGDTPAKPRVATGDTTLVEFLRLYRFRAGRGLQITDFRRTPVQQARAIRNNVASFGVAYVIAEYRRKPAIREIVAAYRANRRRPQRVIREMTRVIEDQIGRGVFISNHLLGLAVDFRSRGRYGARLSVLRQVARSMGARVVVTKNHYHVDLA